MSDMKDKNVIITGASRGNGAATASRLAREGVNLVLVYQRDEESAHALRQSLDDALGRISWVRADIGSPEGCDRVISFSTEKFEGRIDALVNNAAVCVEEPFALLEDEDAARMIAVNIFGVVRLTRAVLRPMLLRRSVSPRLRPVSAQGETRFMPVPRGLSKALRGRSPKRWAKRAFASTPWRPD